jgi:hypothetical protein
MLVHRCHRTSTYSITYYTAATVRQKARLFRRKSSSSPKHEVRSFTSFTVHYPNPSIFTTLQPSSAGRGYENRLYFPYHPIKRDMGGGGSYGPELDSGGITLGSLPRSLVHRPNALRMGLSLEARVIATSSALGKIRLLSRLPKQVQSGTQNHPPFIFLCECIQALISLD